MNWSITWIIFPLLFDVYNEERKKKRLYRRNLIREAALGNEEKIILDSIDDLPAWVYFPDIERAEWVNKMIKQFWPNINSYACEFITNTLGGILKKKLQKYSLKGLTFQRVIIGNVPFRIGGIIVYDNVSRDEIVMDVDVSYAGDCDIKFRLRGLNGGIKNFQLYGKLRVVLKPLIDSLPIIGGLQAFFLNNPEIDFELDGIAGILEIPGINDLLKKSIADTVSSLIVLPNKFPIKLSKEVSGAVLKNLQQLVHVIEARDLLKKDIGFTGKGKSDPYTLLEVGEQNHRTETIFNTVNPVWNFWCEFIILEFTGQQLNVNVWDHDTTNDEFLGSASLDISNLIKIGLSDMWLNLEEVKHGKIHIRCMWLALSTDYSHLHGALYETQLLQLTDMNTALAIVYIDSATDLPQTKAFSKPDPFVQIQVGKQMKCTKTAVKTINPVWEEGFIFFVKNPDADFMDLSIIDEKTETQLCSLSYNLNNLSNKENLEIVEQPFRLENTPNSTISWSLQLKIFKNNQNEDYEDDKHDDKMFNGRRLSSSSNTSKSASVENEPEENSLFANSKSEDAFDHLSIRSSITSTSSSRRSRKSNDITYDAKSDRNLYVKMYLLPERSKDLKRKTTVKSFQDPTFDNTFDYLISQGDLSSKLLEVSVIEEKAMRNSVIGKVVVEIGKLDILKTYTDWFSLEPHLKKE
ncbi:hypothetical protein NQ318_008773 [Aromia moschata]|uniref:Uncharacterized protein n=1 Tax=Aromia moschata TaxID=1265417 RepID=A0AAV8ZA25_9CUCU|nr:hypothetical protein NQ318_008773 [Aromia moschata]